MAVFLRALLFPERLEDLPDAVGLFEIEREAARGGRQLDGGLALRHYVSVSPLGSVPGGSKPRRMLAIEAGLRSVCPQI